MSEERPEVSAAGENPTEPEKKTILIGSQRDPETRKAGQAPLRTYDQMAANAPVVTREEIARRAAAKGTARNNDQPNGGDAQKPPRPPRRDGENGPRSGDRPRGGRDQSRERFGADSPARQPAMRLERTVPVPSRRAKDDDEENAALDALFSDTTADEVMSNADSVASREIIEESTKMDGRVVKITDETVFVDLGARDLGALPVKQFDGEDLPKIGDTLPLVVTKYDKAEGLYDVSLPMAAAEVADWSAATVGAIVEALITEVIETKGLKCTVGRLPGFIPMSHMATFRIEDPSPFVGEKWKCEIIEANPERRSLILSRRNVMRQEREAALAEALEKIQIGQVVEGTVRNIIGAGAFIDMGALEGFIPISQMSWGRVEKVEDLLAVGDRVKVVISRIGDDPKHPGRKRISLSLRDTLPHPWEAVPATFSVGQTTRGKVVSIMSFGAFVELAPGVEGLVHISEISYARINKVEDVLNVGDFVDVKILTIDEEKQRIGLSIKQTAEDPRTIEARQAEEQAQKAAAEEQAKIDAEVAETYKRIEENRVNEKKLKGGTNNPSSEGSKFGLKW
ncbi:MAG: S1 RNA-binding domain-containing protein [Thermoguttaceae bacterium]|nr:S1 RNA-binding domain-containing protein [Thermoguttaceae bacterium]